MRLKTKRKGKEKEVRNTMWNCVKGKVCHNENIKGQEEKQVKGAKKEIDEAKC